MSNLKAWRFNDADTYAGRTAEEAILAKMADACMTRDEVVDFEPVEVDPSTVVMDGDEPEIKTTVGAILAEMSGPGMVSSTDQ